MEVFGLWLWLWLWLWRGAPAGTWAGIEARLGKGRGCGWTCDRGMGDDRNRRLALLYFCMHFVLHISWAFCGRSTGGPWAPQGNPWTLRGQPTGGSGATHGPTTDCNSRTTQE